ncbi:hypothetical protein, partial [Bacillus cereus]|uniref:hypothetical protein n=1 Tax=Bacillus cereus TaxID=1396 RepID=UPI0034D6268D
MFVIGCVHSTLQMCCKLEIARDVNEEFRLAPVQPLAQEVSFSLPSHTVGRTVASISVEKEDHPKQEMKLDYGREQQ